MSQSQPSHDPRPTIRWIAQELLVSGSGRSVDVMDGPEVSIAALTAGLDPEAVDRVGPDFRFGAMEALSAVHAVICEQMLSATTHELLLKRPRSIALTAIASDPGLQQKQLSQATGIQESNLSQYVRELAEAALIEPALPSAGRGKAWQLSQWGHHALVTLSDVVAAATSPEEYAIALRGAIRLHGVLRSRGNDNGMTIPKSEFYRRLQVAIETEASEPIQLTTLFSGDLRDHQTPWTFHERVFKEGILNRPVHWIFLRNSTNQPWVDDLIDHAQGNELVSASILEDIDSPATTVQVLDEEGLFYPIGPDDEGLLRSRADAQRAWDQLAERAEPKIEHGARAELSTV